jgi:hypothetical protein
LQICGLYLAKREDSNNNGFRARRYDMTLRILTLVGAVVWLTQSASAACSHSVSKPWASAKKYGLVLNAYSVGEKCGSTAVVLSVTSRSGETLWVSAYTADTVAVFARDGARSEKGLKAALKDWITIGQESKMKRVSDLPDWLAGASGVLPPGAEFGYVPDEETLSREFYLEQRNAGAPLFCFVTGMESETCIIATDAKSVTAFGGTRFPG